MSTDASSSSCEKRLNVSCAEFFDTTEIDRNVLDKESHRDRLVSAADHLVFA